MVSKPARPGSRKRCAWVFPSGQACHFQGRVRHYFKQGEFWFCSETHFLWYLERYRDDIVRRKKLKERVV